MWEGVAEVVLGQKGELGWKKVEFEGVVVKSVQNYRFRVGFGLWKGEGVRDCWQLRGEWEGYQNLLDLCVHSPGDKMREK